MRQNFMRQHQLVPSDLVGYEISPLRSRANKMKAAGSRQIPSASAQKKQTSQTNIIIKSLKNIASDQSTEDDDNILNLSTKLTIAGSNIQLPRNIKQNSGEERAQNFGTSTTLSSSQNLRSQSTGQLQSLQKAKAKLNSYQKYSNHHSIVSMEQLEQNNNQKNKKNSKNLSNSFILADKEQYRGCEEEEEEEDHNIWDNDLMLIRGIDTENWLDNNGKPFTLFHLYKARFGTHPNQREEISNEEVIKMMKRFSRNRRNKNLERFPWDNFKDTCVYYDESDLYQNKNFQNFHKMFNAYYNNDIVRNQRNIAKNTFISSNQIQRNSLSDEHLESTLIHSHSFLQTKNVRSMSQIGQINQQQQILSNLNSFRIRQISNNSTQQQPLNNQQIKSQNLIAYPNVNDNPMLSSNMIISKDSSPTKQSKIYQTSQQQQNQQQYQGNSPLTSFSPIKKVFGQQIQQNESTQSSQSPVKRYQMSGSMDQQTFSKVLEQVQNSANKQIQPFQNKQESSFKYQLINALKSTNTGVVEPKEEAYQNYLSQKIKIIQTQKIKEQATQIETRKQSFIKRQNSVNPSQKYAGIANNNPQYNNISFAKYSQNEIPLMNSQNNSQYNDSTTPPVKKGSFSPVKARNSNNQTTVGNLLHQKSIHSQSHQPSPFNDLNSVKKINILSLLK